MSESKLRSPERKRAKPVIGLNFFIEQNTLMNILSNLF